MEPTVTVSILAGLVAGVVVLVVAVVISIVAHYVAAGKVSEEDARRYRTQYGKALGLKYRQLVVRDEYGHMSNDRWERELTYFMRNALDMPKPTRTGDHPGKFVREYARKYIATRVLIDSIARDFSQTLPVMGDISEVLNGLDYEHFVGKRFNEAGWTSQVTKASGDQGADVKVWRDGVDAVVQCKWYQNAVGNKAVQEIVAARTHYGVRKAIVVSKSGYTDAARELANTNAVCLIHHDEIPDLYERLSDLNKGVGADST
jgi:restriction system protein